MSIFTYREGKIQVEPQNLTIPEFKEIYERDKSKDKDVAFVELCYVYHMADFRSVYNNLDTNEKEERIILDFITDKKWKPDSLLKRAIEKYKELNETPSMKLLRDTRIGFEKVREYYIKVDLEDRDAKGQKVNKISELSNSLASVGKMIDSLNTIEERVKKEESISSKIRGDKKISDFERV